jgi:hypothetical protein
MTTISCAASVYRVEMPSRGHRMALLGVLAACAFGVALWFPTVLHMGQLFVMGVLACWAGIESLWSP